MWEWVERAVAGAVAGQEGLEGEELAGKVLGTSILLAWETIFEGQSERRIGPTGLASEKGHQPTEALPMSAWKRLAGKQQPPAGLE